LLPIAEQNKRQAFECDKLRIELEPLVELTFSQLERHPDAYDLFAPLWTAFDQAAIGIEHNELVAKNRAADDLWQQSAHMSQLVRRVAQLSKQANERVGAFNEAVGRWIARRDELERRQRVRS
jgi:hypothetical protein